MGTTNQLVTKELKSLKRAHSLRSRLRIAEHDVSLPTHLHRLHGDDIEDRAVGGEERVEGEAEVVFLDLRGREVRDVESIIVSL